MGYVRSSSRCTPLLRQQKWKAAAIYSLRFLIKWSPLSRRRQLSGVLALEGAYQRRPISPEACTFVRKGSWLSVRSPTFNSEHLWKVCWAANTSDDSTLSRPLNHSDKGRMLSALSCASSWTKISIVQTGKPNAPAPESPSPPSPFQGLLQPRPKSPFLYFATARRANRLNLLLEQHADDI